MNTATCRSTARIVGFGPLKVLKPLRFFREISGTPKAFDLAIETWHVPRRAPCHALPSVAIRSGIGQSVAFAEKACHLLFRYIFSSRASPRAATRRALPATARRHERRRVRRAAPYPNSNSNGKAEREPSEAYNGPRSINFLQHAHGFTCNATARHDTHASARFSLCQSHSTPPL